MNDFGYTLAERKSPYGFVPLMELWKLRNSQLCLPAPEVKETTPEIVEEEVAPETEVVQHDATLPEADNVSKPLNCAMETVDAQVVVSETHQFQASAFKHIQVAVPNTIEEIKANNARVNERLDK